MRRRRTILLCFLAALLPALCAGCAPVKEAPKVSEVGFYLDTVITLTAYTEDGQVLKDALEECGRYERLLSRTERGSDVWNLNHAGGQPVEVSEDTLAILRCAQEISRLSGGAFDVTIAPVSTLWDFTSGEAKLPDRRKLERAAALVDYTKIRMDGNRVVLPEGMMIDLGESPRARSQTGSRITWKSGASGTRSSPLAGISWRSGKSRTAGTGRSVSRISTGPRGKSCWFPGTAGAPR